MSIKIVFHSTQEDYKRAQKNAYKQATTLPALIKEFVDSLAKKQIPDETAFIHEADAAKEVWCATRSTLYSMRQTGELTQGELTKKSLLKPAEAHYVVVEGMIYYKLSALRDFFKTNYSHIEETNKKKLPEND